MNAAKKTKEGGEAAPPPTMENKNQRFKRKRENHNIDEPFRRHWVRFRYGRENLHQRHEHSPRGQEHHNVAPAWVVRTTSIPYSISVRVANGKSECKSHSLVESGAPGRDRTYDRRIEVSRGRIELPYAV